MDVQYIGSAWVGSRYECSPDICGGSGPDSPPPHLGIGPPGLPGVNARGKPISRGTTARLNGAATELGSTVALLTRWAQFGATPERWGVGGARDAVRNVCEVLYTKPACRVRSRAARSRPALT